MFRKPLFWVLFVLLSSTCAFVAVRYFYRAFPIVTLDLKMSRESALSAARGIAARFQLPPDGFEQAASFGGDSEVQAFVELEAGGTQAFQRMLAEGLYHSYSWTVRHFRPGETRETRLAFTPAGVPYGLSVKLPEDAPGPVLDAPSAQSLAEQSAAADWKIDLSKYSLVESSRELRPGGRADHTFVYERADVRIGEGRYRLRIVVAGEKLTEVTHFVKVPEAFTRRYEEMRSANSAIGAADMILWILLYLVGGCIGGIFFLMRRRAVLWRQPVAWGVFIALLQLLAGISQWPQVWVAYDTAISPRGFVLQQILLLLAQFAGVAALCSVSFMAAESLSRQAFPHHVQHWRLWSRDVAPSPTVLGFTSAGYLLVAVFFAYEVALYFVTSRWLGWWTPSDALVQPDVLATYMPWLSAIAPSAQAGFWEECLFRALPLAGAALLGNRFGGRKWWLAGAMVLQALVFGGGHAEYPNQPAYARVAELAIPSFVFGALYLRFGLLPAIVMHYAYDVVWFALPLFVSTAPGIWLDRTLVILFTLVPFWVVMVQRLRAGRWISIDASVLNRAWQPPEPVQGAAAGVEAPAARMSPLAVRILPLAGILGLAVWAGVGRFRSDAPPLTLERAEAEALARQALEERGIRLSAPWRALSSVQGASDLPDQFIWQTAGREAYQKVMEDYLAPPYWRVRFVRFEGDVAERAEEHQVFVSDARRVFRVRFIPPEARPGPSIAEAQARSLAHEAVRRQFGLDPATLKEISLVPSKLKARTDWLATFADPRGQALPQGEKRLSVRIAGDAVADAWKFIYVPEEWERQERDRRQLPGMLEWACRILLILAVVAGIGTAVFFWSRKEFSPRTFVALGVALAAVNLADLVNMIPAVRAEFSTAQPFKVQMFILAGVGAVGVLLLSFGIAAVAGLVRRLAGGTERPSTTSDWTLGISLGFLLAGLSTAGRRLAPSLTPLWGDFSALGGYIPLGQAVLDPISSYLTQSIIAIWIIVSINLLTQRWTRRKWAGISLFLLTGLVLTGLRGIETIPSWLAGGILTAGLLIAAYLLVLRHRLPVAAIAIAAASCLGLVRAATISPYPASAAGAAAGVALTVVAAYVWWRKLTTPEGCG